MTRIIATSLVALLLAVGTLTASAQDARPYTEGPVTVVSFIKTKPGMFDTYMAWVAGERKQLMDAYKKAGVIVDYAVYSTQPRGPHDADIILTVTYKNFAAFDGLTDRQEGVARPVMGTREQANQKAISREAMRETLGQQVIQQLVLK